MENHDAQDVPKAAGEHIEQDIGGWISGSSLDEPEAVGEPVASGSILAGDTLIIGEVRVKVDAVDAIQFIDDGTGEMVDGLAIWWTAPNSRGILCRRADDLVYRAGRGRSGPGPPGRHRGAGGRQGCFL